MSTDTFDDVFFCDGCGQDFPNEERADQGEPYCVACWERLPHDDDPETGT